MPAIRPTVRSAPPTGLRAVRRGYASAVSDTGPDAAVEPLATFAQNRQKL